MNSGIYIITNVLDGRKYVGSAKNLKRRQYQHWWELKRGEHKNSYMQNSWNHSGSGHFHFSVLEYCVEELLEEREDWWIDYLGTLDRSKGYNLKSADRTKVSDYTRKKISDSKKGKPRPELSGDNHPSKRSEVRANLSAAGMGHTVSPETREKIANSLRGRKTGPKSAETKAKIAASKVGKPRPDVSGDKNPAKRPEIRIKLKRAQEERRKTSGSPNGLSQSL